MIDPSMVAINMPRVVFDEGDPLVPVAHDGRRCRTGHAVIPPRSKTAVAHRGTRFTFTSTEILARRRPTTGRGRWLQGPLFSRVGGPGQTGAIRPTHPLAGSVRA